MEFRKGFLYTIRAILAVTLLSLVAFIAYGSSEEIKQPKFFVCEASNGVVAIRRICLRVQLAESTYIMIFKPDGQIVDAIFRLDEDGSSTLVYQSPKTTSA